MGPKKRTIKLWQYVLVQMVLVIFEAIVLIPEIFGGFVPVVFFLGAGMRFFLFILVNMVQHTAGFFITRG